MAPVITGLGERLALVAGGALALALVQLLQATLKNTRTRTAEKQAWQNGTRSTHSGSEQVTRHPLVWAVMCRAE